MRFGVCTDLQNVPILKNAGYDYVECKLDEISYLNSQELKEAQALLAAYDMKMEVTNHFMPGDEMLLTGEEAVSKAVLHDYIRACLENASALGLKKCVFGSGAARTVPHGFPLEKGYNQLLEVFSLAADMTAEYGIKLVIEPLRKKENNTIFSLRKAAQFAKDLNHPNVYLLADLFHMVEEQEDMGAITENGSQMRHFHLNNPLSVPRSYPTLEDAYDYVPFAKAILDTGYDETVSIEANVKNLAQDAKNAMAVLQKYFVR